MAQNNIRQKRQEVEFVLNQSGTNTSASTDVGGGLQRGSLSAGDWMELNGPFNLLNINALTFRVTGGTAGGPSGTVELWRDAINAAGGGTMVSSQTITGTAAGTYASQTFPLVDPGGAHRLFLVFANANTYSLNWVEFVGPGVGSAVERLARSGGGAAAAAAPPSLSLHSGQERSQIRFDSPEDRKMERRSTASVASSSSARRPGRPRQPGLPGPGPQRRWRATGRTAGKDALITIPTLGVQQFSIRDATGRLGVTNNPSPTMGFLGGPDFPEDPNDLGPLVPLPGGFAEVFEYLASIGYRGIEFFSFNQNIGTLGRQPTVEEIRSYLDAAGLSPRHPPGQHRRHVRPGHRRPLDRGMTQVANAHILGHEIIGTAGDPSNRTTLEDNPTNPNQIGWQEAARRANIIGAAIREEGMGLLLPSGAEHVPTLRSGREPGARGDAPDLVVLRQHRPEQGVLRAGHPALLSGRKRFPLPSGPDFDPYGWVTSTRSGSSPTT